MPACFRPGAVLRRQQLLPGRTATELARVRPCLDRARSTSIPSSRYHGTTKSFPPASMRTSGPAQAHSNWQSWPLNTSRSGDASGLGTSGRFPGCLGGQPEDARGLPLEKTDPLVPSPTSIIACNELSSLSDVPCPHRLGRRNHLPLL